MHQVVRDLFLMLCVDSISLGLCEALGAVAQDASLTVITSAYSTYYATYIRASNQEGYIITYSTSTLFKTVTTTASPASTTPLDLPSCLASTFSLAAADARLTVKTICVTPWLSGGAAQCTGVDFGGDIEQCAYAKCSGVNYTEALDRWESEFCSFTAQDDSAPPSATASPTQLTTNIETPAAASSTSASAVVTTYFLQTSVTSTSWPVLASSLSSTPTALPSSTPPAASLNLPTKVGIGVGAVCGGFLVFAFLASTVRSFTQKSRRDHQEHDIVRRSQVQEWRKSELPGDVVYAAQSKYRQADSQPSPVELPAEEIRLTGTSRLGV